MGNIFDRIRKKVLSVVKPGFSAKAPHIDNLIALGVMLWKVAHADKKFLPTELEKIEEALHTYASIDSEDMSIVVRAIQEAALDHEDFDDLVAELNEELTLEVKKDVIGNLFRVAWGDNELDGAEDQCITNIAQKWALSVNEIKEIRNKARK